MDRWKGLVFVCCVGVAMARFAQVPHLPASGRDEDANDSRAALNARRGGMDDEGMSLEDAARASIDVTNNGEKKYVTKDSEKEPTEGDHRFEVTLQKLEAEQIENDGAYLTEANIRLLEEEARKQSGKQYPSVMDTPAALVPPDGSMKSRRKRQIITNTWYHWESGIVPVDFDRASKKVSNYAKANIKIAMKYLEDTTCLKFPIWTEALQGELNLSHNNYLKFGKYDGCWSYVGNLHKNGQDISACSSVGVILHEIGHALGAPHQQDRSDRDRYVEQHPENAKPDYKGVFTGGPSNSYTLYHPYDLGSNMHYGTHYFSWNGRPTISIRDPDRKFLLWSSSDTISHYDIMAITKGYSCIDTCPADKQRLQCENDGFVTPTRGTCGCRCVVGLEGATCNQTKKNPSTVSSWPAGAYGLAMTNDGCPGSSFTTGSRYHAMDGDTYAEKDYTIKPTISGYHIEDHFCMADSNSSSGRQWDEGSYCIYQKSDSCPEGFTSGYILYDNKNGATTNKVNGSLPKGVYTNDTTYYYCCRNDGSASSPIDLPIDTPFHLFRFGGRCQSVKGMGVSSYFVKYDTVNEITENRRGGTYPDHNKYWGNVYLFYCYYHVVNYDCGKIVELSDSNKIAYVTSPNYPNTYNNYEECNWLIKSPDKTRIHIEMESMDIEDSDSNECIDSLEIRHNLLGQNGNRFCGSVVMKRSIVSDENRAMLTLRTNHKNTKGGFKVKLTLIKDSEMCYNMKDNGATYRGSVNYTQHYQKCVSWEKTRHCKINPFTTTYMNKGLVGHNNCRNPNDALRPWCYINEHCDMNFCDVCGIERCFDVYSDCADQMERDVNFCSTDHGFTGCHKTCNLCGLGHPAYNSSVKCPLPTPVDQSAVVLTTAGQTSVSPGDSINLQCQSGGQNVTSTLTCMSDATFEGPNPFCHILCPDGWVRNEDRCYYLVTTAKFFEYAKDDCEAMGATVTSVQTQAENDFLVELMIAGGVYGTYIGMNDENEDNEWRWVDGAAVTYTNWQSGEPSGAYDHCGRLSSNGKWSSVYCKWHYPKPFICKKKFTVSDTPCVDQRADCAEIITRNPYICRNHASFSSRFCRETCGICPYAKCRNPGPVANAELSQTSFYLMAGDYVEYTCKEGFAHKSGNLQRACLSKGRLTGSAPVCTPTGEHEQILGFRRINRSYRDESNRAVIYDAKESTFTRSGVVSAWEIYSTANTYMLAQVWRRADANDTSKHTLVGSNMVNLRENRVNRIVVPKFERIEVQEGDLVGWYYPDGAVGLRYDHCASNYADRGYHVTEASLSRIYEGVGTEFSTHSSGKCRTYSIAAVLSPGETLHTTNIASKKFATKCAASYQSHTCYRAFDGRLTPFDAEWISDGGIGTWIRLDFVNSFRLVGVRIMQRLCACGQNKGVNFHFSDGSMQHETLNARPGKSSTDTSAIGWDSFDIQAVDSSYIVITVDSVYSTQNNGFIEIAVYAECRTGFERFQDACYLLRTESLLYMPARDNCTALGAQLTSVHSAEENLFLMNLKAEHSIDRIYLGLSDRAQDDTWLWEDSSEYGNYTNWEATEPWSGDNHYDCARQNADGTWATQYCYWHYPRPYVCRWTLPDITSKTQRIGNQAVPGTGKAWNHYVHVSTAAENKIPFDGKIDSWIVYSSVDTVMVAQVWRQDATDSDQLTFTLIGNNYIKLVAGLSNLYDVPEFAKFDVRKGDYIGFYLPDVPVGVEYVKCSSNEKIYYAKFTDGMKDMLGHGVNVTMEAGTNCYKFLIGAVVNPEPSIAFLNVASTGKGGKCANSSSNNATCGRVVDGDLTTPGGEWKTSGGNEGVGSWLHIDLAGTYRVLGARIMQRLNGEGQNKDLTFSFSDNSTQTTTLSKGWGRSNTDSRSYFWNELILSPVDTDSVHVYVSSAYSTLENGFIEIEFIADCPKGWTRFVDSCYKAHTTKKHYAAAEAQCTSEGAHISSILSEEEGKFVYGFIGERAHWIGLNDRETEGTFKWLDGHPVNYTNWKSGEPDNWNGEDCAYVKYSSLLWRDLYCEWYYPQAYVCKKPIQ